MNRTKTRVLSLMLIVALLAIPTFTVLAKELGQLDVSGPGIKGQLTLTDHDQMIQLEEAGFFDYARAVKAPENLGAGYNVTAHLNLDGKLVPFLEMTYYPAEAGEPGYWHYTGRLNGEKLQAVDEWVQLSPKAEEAFRDVMTANKVALQPAILAAAAAPAGVVPATGGAEAPAVSSAPAPENNPYLIPTIIAAGLILLGVVLSLRRRIANQRSA